MQAMGGRVWGRPREGGGSEFGFALKVLVETDDPVLEAGAPSQSAASPESGGGDRGGGNPPANGTGGGVAVPDPLGAELATLQVAMTEMVTEPA